MNEANVFFGHHCPRCGTTIGFAAAIGNLRCPGCGGPMQAGSGGPPIRNLANFRCKRCGSMIGMLTSVGNATIKCPSCGADY